MFSSRLLRAPFVLSLLALASGCVAASEGDDADDVPSATGDAPLTIGGATCPTLNEKSVTASGAQDGNPASNAVDGQLDTRWSQLGLGSSVTLDLGAATALCGVGVAWYQGAERTNKYVIGLSTDGVSFAPARTGTSTGQTASVEQYPVGGTARYVRVTVNGNSVNDWASISEIQLYGAPAAAPAAPGVPGSYKPSASTTGVPAGTTLQPYNTGGADLVITQDGTVLDKLDIYGDIKVRARNVTIKNSRLRGGKGIPRGNTGIVDANAASVQNLVVQDCTITPDSPSYYRDGIVGHDYTSRRNHIYRTNDGLGIFNVPGGPAAANVNAEANYIHTLTFWSNDPAHSDGTHNDCIQVQGGENIRIFGNTIKCDQVIGTGSGPSSRGTHAGLGIMLQQNVAKLRNVVVQQNWVDDGGSSINIDHTPSKGHTSITLTLQDNKLGRNQLDFGNGSKYPIRIVDKSASQITGLDQNRWEDNGVLLREGRDLGIRYNSE